MVVNRSTAMVECVDDLRAFVLLFQMFVHIQKANMDQLSEIRCRRGSPAAHWLAPLLPYPSSAIETPTKVCTVHAEDSIILCLYVVCCCCIPSTSRFDISSIQRCSSHYCRSGPPLFVLLEYGHHVAKSIHPPFGGTRRTVLV